MRFPFPRKPRLSAGTRRALEEYRMACMAEAALFRFRTEYAIWAQEVPQEEAAEFNERCEAIRSEYDREFEF